MLSNRKTKKWYEGYGLGGCVILGMSLQKVIAALDGPLDLISGPLGLAAPLMLAFIMLNTAEHFRITKETRRVVKRLGRVTTRPPGSRLLSVVNFSYSKKTVDRVFSQIIRDMREEYLEALAAGNLWHARWIHVRGVLSFLTTVVVHAGSSIAVKVFKMVSALWVA